MILNVSSVIALFLAGAGFVLALAAGAIGARGWLALRRGADQEGRLIAEERSHLLVLMVGVLAGVRLLAWPHFYWLLKSYVDDLAVFGVMCAFGVTQIQPGLVLTLQVVKPVVLLAAGFWWLLVVVDRRSSSAPLLRARLALAVPLAALAALECSAEVVYVLREKVGQRVTCCTQFLDTQALGSAISPGRVATGIGNAPPAAGWGGYVLLHALAIGTALHLRKHGVPSRGVGGVLWPAGALAIGLANLLVTRWTWLELLAPRVLQLPYHHCVYELLTDTPALGLAAMMAVAGNGCLAWPLFLQFWRAKEPEALSTLEKGVYALCALALASELLIVGIHAA